jgi:hypothetical protein
MKRSHIRLVDDIGVAAVRLRSLLLQAQSAGVFDEDASASAKSITAGLSVLIVRSTARVIREQRSLDFDSPNAKAR